MSEAIATAQSVTGGQAAPSGPRGGVRRLTTAAAIHAELREGIVSMRLLPGAALQEKRLTQHFAVSRTPLREALIRLAEEGLVDIFPQSGTFVSRIPVAAIPEAVVIRQALEDTTIARAAAGAGPAELARLDAILSWQRHLAEAGDQRAFHEADESFHETIAAIAGYPGIWRLLTQVKTQIDRARRLTLPVPGRMAHVVGDHAVIRDAIAAHDVEAARAAMRHHLSAVIPDVETLRLQHPDYFA
ncbi:GntR family transcriptional regulator [Labrys wisconsinensis]|uniref:DNA-binding GntR family transcriptional regulator n=1 Tax=Labrys wisconsinensis TaxID=425677 RepID=A0ABU0J612_9HYPH|nr:GntR family transcriptional regulator [Labrys wisconsinensis]MDQ0469080.1 DNA-binding GntR family transcriptional regulator [Labrys wisconsinensis]